MSATDASLKSNPDLGKDIATLLREGIAEIHEITENKKGAVWLSRGELDKEEYIRFLIMMWHVYSNLEEGLEAHSSHPVLAPLYNPTLIFRADALSSDIAHLLAIPETEWPSHPLALSISKAPPPALAEYTSRLRLLSSTSDSYKLLSHAYVRYLGDLSGGQIIRRNVAKAYKLDTQTGLGIQFYDFQKLGGGRAANMGDMRTIKLWFRDGMNKGVGDDPVRKDGVLSEAHIAFRLNADIFDILRAPSASKIALSNKEPSIIGIKPSEPGLVSVAGVLSFILAMGFAHFALVTGGFLGDPGLDKWERAMGWFGNIFGMPAAS